MSMMPTVPLPFSLPGASSTLGMAPVRSGSPGAPARRFVTALLQRLAATGEAGIGHEILVRVDRRLALPGAESFAAAVGQYPPTLLIVGEVCDHDLAHDLLVDRGGQDRHHG